MVRAHSFYLVKFSIIVMYVGPEALRERQLLVAIYPSHVSTIYGTSTE